MSVFPKFIEKYGHSIESESVPEEIINKYKNILPDTLIKFWEEEGFGGFGNGLFWIINPDSYIDYIPKILELRSDAIPFMRTAFGDLLVYAKSKDDDYVILIDLRLQQCDIAASKFSIFFEKILCHNSYSLSTTRTKGFASVITKLRKLKKDECYYKATLSSGEDDSCDSKIINFTEYFDSSVKSPNGFID